MSEAHFYLNSSSLSDLQREVTALFALRKRVADAELAAMRRAHEVRAAVDRRVPPRGRRKHH
ncbi:hypothetical protein I6F35_11705 [Bradyrhizobium sp. BRP22]|uniref:hypothetical protein n=1 Tax=Bradyrhizobium sp. BRP22 TaxID=2793821 RepID=UPI001CD6FBA4|nr:hypothetical protein [Bradyrhizobium sp. BRP22]MCA1453879.1 hypothetical protein [Bradyrhizobium sp. BRP22]